MILQNSVDLKKNFPLQSFMKCGYLNYWIYFVRLRNLLCWMVSSKFFFTHWIYQDVYNTLT